MNIIKKSTIIGLGVGLILGLIYSVGGFFIDLFVTLGWMTSSETPGLSHGTLLALGALVGMPIMVGTIGLLVGTTIMIISKLIKR